MAINEIYEARQTDARVWAHTAATHFMEGRTAEAGAAAQIALANAALAANELRRLTWEGSRPSWEPHNQLIEMQGGVR